MSERENLALSQAEAWRETLAELWQAIDSGEEYEGQDPNEYLSEIPLEIVWETGEPFAVVLGTGGPHTEITGGGRWSGSGYTLECYWGGDRATLRGETINRTGDYFRELVSE